MGMYLCMYFLSESYILVLKYQCNGSMMINVYAGELLFVNRVLEYNVSLVLSRVPVKEVLFQEKSYIRCSFAIFVRFNARAATPTLLQLRKIPCGRAISKKKVIDKACSSFASNINSDK